jgi:hypothetical protein
MELVINKGQADKFLVPVLRGQDGRRRLWIRKI